MGLPQESPDGTRVYFARYLTAGAELWSMLPDGRDQHALEGMPRLALADEWVPAGNGVYYIDAVAVPPTLNFFDLRTHRSHRIVNLQGLVNDWGAGPSLSSDGHTIVYAENDLVSGDIMLADGFR
jgi:Tol biopolymer transport system component